MHKCSVIRWTNNKKIVTPVKGSNVDTVTLSVLLSHIAIKLQKDKFNRRSVCKKCARKATSTYSTFIEICEVLKKNGSLSSQVETPPSSPNAHGRKGRFNKSSAKDLVLDFDRFSAYIYSNNLLIY